MKNGLKYSCVIIGMLLVTTCNAEDQTLTGNNDLFSMDNLVAWCIVPYDNQDRTPQERAEMLDDLGFTKMAYDWRDEHLPHFPDEIRALQQHDIALTAVWLWIDERATDGFLPEHEMLFEAVEEAGESTSFWIGMHENFYEGLEDEERVDKVAEMAHRVHQRAQASGSTVALYNHGGWLGVPENQVRVIEAAGDDDIGIVFNFHHGHDQIDRFDEALDMMMPYLETVNLNGMEKDGAHILDLGKGDHEQEMIATLIDSGFSGDIGIIGHTEGEDVRNVLTRNLNGLQQILTEIDEQE